MSDSLSGLSNALRGGDILSRIANPTVVNPLAAYTGAAQTAQAIYGVREKQADAAWGNALQQATDADGNVDIPKAQALAAKDPLAMQGMLKALPTASSLSNEQQARGVIGNRAYSDAATAALAAPDGQLHDAAVTQVQRLIDLNLLPRDQGMRILARLPGADNPTALRAALEQIRIAHLPPEAQAAQLYGGRGTQTGPTGATIGYTQQPAGGTMAGGQSATGAVSAPPQAGAPQGTSPETRAAERDVYIPDPDHPGQWLKVPQPRSARPGASGSPEPSPVPAPLVGPLGTGRPKPTASTTPPVLAEPPQGQTAQLSADQTAFRQEQTETQPLTLNNTQFKEAHDAILRLQKSGLPTTAAFQDSLAYARRVAVALGAGPETTQNMIDTATAEKYLSAAIAGKATRSNAQQDLAEHANPTLQTPAGASLPMIRQIVGGNRARQLAVATADQTGAGFISHNTERSRLYNSPEGLMALSFDMVPPGPEQEKALAEIKARGPAAVKRFVDVLKEAHDKKVLPEGSSGGS